MAKITRTQQRRLVTTSIALIFTAALMMPTVTDARGGGGHGGSGHHGGVRNIGILGFTPHRVSPAQPGFSVAHRNFHNSSRHSFSRRRIASRPSRAFGSDFVSLAPNNLWFDTVGATPTILFTQDAPITQEIAGARSTAVKTPDAEQDGILVVRGNSKAYVTFPSGKPG